MHEGAKARRKTEKTFYKEVAEGSEIGGVGLRQDGFEL
jgi:hypothetical protein